LPGHAKAGFRQELVPMLTFKDRATAPKHVLVRLLDEESVLLNLETERYFGLDETGTRMWQLVTTSSNLDAAYQELLAEYNVQPELLREDLTELVGRLAEHGLLQILPADAGKLAEV
jgi:Coenzyme PQQ synthesis protein D (PqqD)